MGTEYVIAVCDRCDFAREGDHFSFSSMREAPAAFLSAFDQQVVDADEDLRAWLVEAGRKTKPAGALTVAEAAMRENVSPRTVQRWCERGELGGGAWRTSSGARSSWRIEQEALDQRRARPSRRSAAPIVKVADVTAPRRSRSVVW
jgi:excisionase family DNA binding protein